MNDLMLYVDEDHWDIITDQHGLRAAATYGDDRETRRLLAERMVLCWEACRGLTNDELAAGPSPLTEAAVKDLLPIMQDGWTLAEYGMWVARAVERAHGIKTPNAEVTGATHHETNKER